MNHLIGVTMPGFGTTDRTYLNAVSLLEGLRAKVRNISIRDAVTVHLSDIDQDPDLHDVTYENAQARERTQILLDIANQEGGLVVGTGDFSEEVLGFCTFGGDQLANYNVNVFIPKTLMRSMVQHVADRGENEPIRPILTDILDTPVSPELLPSSDRITPAQKTESILGPYELHDFFAYYFLKYQFSPRKLYLYARAAFGEQYPPAFLKETLTTFFKRFFASQFKRSCAPDSARLTDLGCNDLGLPSDVSAKAILKEVEQIPE